MELIFLLLFILFLLGGLVYPADPAFGMMILLSISIVPIGLLALWFQYEISKFEKVSSVLSEENFKKRYPNAEILTLQELLERSKPKE
jgi:hypothetical protein